MADLARGLYEILLTEALAHQLRELDERLAADTTKLRPADAADRLALHVGRLLRRALSGVEDSERVEVGVHLARRLVADIAEELESSGAEQESPVEPAAVLQAIQARQPDGTAESIALPLTSYVSHEGELPMAITWRLAHPLPGDLFAAFAAAVA